MLYSRNNRYIINGFLKKGMQVNVTKNDRVRESKILIGDERMDQVNELHKWGVGIRDCVYLHI